MAQAADSSIVLMSKARVERSINRMAYQITEDNKEEADMLVVGLKERGYVIAAMLAERLDSLSSRQVELLQMKDEKDGSKPLNDAGDFSYLILVDDVIFSGHTMLKALNTIQQAHKKATMRTALLVDRGHRSVPVGASFIGLQLPTKLDEHVRVVTDGEAVKKVVLDYSSH